MTSPPCRVKVGHLDYEVQEADVVKMGDEEVYADVDHELAVIRLQRDLAPQVKAEKLIHELLHVAYDSWNINPRWGEERTVTVLAPALATIIRDNPALLTWLHSVFHTTR